MSIMSTTDFNRLILELDITAKRIRNGELDKEQVKWLLAEIHKIEREIWANGCMER